MTTDRPYYPDCSGCGHNASGVVAGRCTAFVADADGWPEMCNHGCLLDEVVGHWYSQQQAPR